MVQIDGLSGTGKSTLCGELARRGLRAIDGDEAFGYYGDPLTGVPSEVEVRAHWIWNEQRVRAVARASHGPPVFICGGAMNQDLFLDLFVKRFMLHIDDYTMRRRLPTRTNNDFGKAPDELAEQLDLNAHAMEDARRIGSILIDATRPIIRVADDIVKMTV